MLTKVVRKSTGHAKKINEMLTEGLLAKGKVGGRSPGSMKSCRMLTEGPVDAREVDGSLVMVLRTQRKLTKVECRSSGCAKS